MKSKKIIILPCLVIFLLTIFYIIFATKPLAKEFQFIPEWKISVLSPIIDKNLNKKETIYFKLGQELGYFTEEGKITFCKTFPFQASISDKYFSTYNSNAQNTPFFDTNGNSKGFIEAAGYPYFIEENAFVFLPGGNSFSKVYDNGKTEWTYEGTIPLTAFSSKNSFTATGFADGKIIIFDNHSGNIIGDYAPGGSDYPVILGIDISNDGKYVASISGQDKQRFVLSQSENQKQKIIYHNFINEGSPYRTLIYFTKNIERVFYVYKNNIGIYNIKSEENFTIPISDRIINIEESEDFVIFLGKTKNTYTVYFIDKTNTLEGKFSFDAKSAFIRVFKNNLYIGNDTYISKIALTRE